MGYKIQFQTEIKYKSMMYGHNSIYNSACGPASLCNALANLGIADVDIPTMCKFAVSCGARVSGGTAMAVLLKAAAAKYGFTYKTTSKNAELWAHLKAGGAALLNNGTQYKLFSNSGHFVCAVGCSGTSTVIVLDSYWYANKYTSTALRRGSVKIIGKGVIQTSLEQCGKATIDRSPSYYLISKKEVATTAASKTAKVTAADKTVKVTAANLNIRSGAGASHGVVGTLPRDSVIQVTGVTNNGWYRILYKGKDGYISSMYASDVKNNRKSQEVKDDMTEAEVRQIIDKVREEERQKAASAWAVNAWNAAKQAGIIDGTMPQAPATREQVIQILSKLGLIGK